jgi:tetratricopeptide (TPR) repeat protein
MIDAEDAKWHCTTVFPTSIFARLATVLSLIAGGGCTNIPSNPQTDHATVVSALIVAEIAVARNDLPAAARQYAAMGASLKTDEEFGRATQVATDAAQPALALGLAERWIDHDPKSADAQRVAARSALELHKIDTSVRHFRALLQLGTHGTEAGFRAIADEFNEADNVYGARQVADLLTAPFDSSPAALKLRGLAQANADDSASASATLRRAVAVDSSPDLAWSLGRALAAAGRVDEALALARRLIADHDDAANHIQYAVLLIDAHREPAAQAELDLLAETPESKPAALRLMGQLQFQLGNLDAAQICFAQLVNSGKFVEDGFYFLGRIAERRRHDQDALRAYVQVTSGDNVLPAMLHAAALLKRDGAPVEADQVLDEMMRLNPSRASQIIVARAQMYADSHEEPRAIETLDAAIADYPDSPDLRYARAEILERVQRVDDSIAELSRLARRRPNDPAAMNALGYTLADHSRELTRARRLIERAYAQAPQSAAIRDSMGWVLFRQGRSVQALPHLTAAYDADRGAETGAHLGEVLWSMGQRAEAQRVWARARDADPDDRILRATMARLNPQS